MCVLPWRGIGFPVACFPDLTVLVSPASTYPLLLLLRSSFLPSLPSLPSVTNHLHPTANHANVSLEIKIFKENTRTLLPSGYSQTSALLTPRRSRAQFLSVQQSLLGQRPPVFCPKALHDYPSVLNLCYCCSARINPWFHPNIIGGK